MNCISFHGVVKYVSSGARLLEFKSQLDHLLRGCVTLDKLFNLPMPQFSYL